MEEISSQNSDLGLEDLDKLEAKGQAENTKRATSWGIKKFEKWCDKRRLKVDFNCVTPVELNELLRKFYAETKEMNPKPTHKSSIAAGDMLKLCGYFSEGLDSNNSWADPERLLQFVWFSPCFHFGRRGREGWRELSKQSFGIKKDDSGARYVTEIQTEQTKNYQGGSKQKDQAYSDVRMYENSTPLDPVGSFEFYISRLHPSCQALFQTPNHHFKKAESRWFRNEPLGKNTIAKLMENISSKAELSERYTNHCIRASTITALYPRGVDAKQICAITKHKDGRSLSHYISQTTSEQKRQCSRLLQEAFYGHPPTQTS